VVELVPNAFASCDCELVSHHEILFDNAFVEVSGVRKGVYILSVA
jgi:hypothetical protein